MSRRSFSIVLSIVLMLVMALAATGAAQAAPSKAKAKEKARHARVVKYWTPARMARAVPRDFVKTKSGFVPAARGGNKPVKPPKGPGGGGDGSGSTVTGESWSGGGPALLASGKVFFTMGGTNYVCSGAVANDGGAAGSLVLTAGHCVYDESRGAYATNWMFAPQYDSAPYGCAGAPLGCFSAAPGNLFAHPKYRSAGGFNTQAIKHDWGFARVSNGGASLDSLVPEFQVHFDSPTTSRAALGYPAASPYAGNDLVYCFGSVISDGALGNATWGMHCDMTPGSSGGPWLKQFAASAGTGILNSVNSYRYNGGKKKKYMFGPKFSSETRGTYVAAGGK